VFAVSVLEEIKKFQEDINKVALENIKFPTWKRGRAGQVSGGSKAFQNLSGSVLSEIPCSQQSNIKNKDKGRDNQNSCDEMLKNTSDNITMIPGQSEHEDDIDNTEEEFVPVLPSVRKLANKFQDMQENNTKQILLTKDINTTIPSMLTVKYPVVSSYQVHSITARSVSREFRDVLKLSRPELTDAIMRIPRTPQRTEEKSWLEKKTVSARQGVMLLGSEGEEGADNSWEA